MAKIRIFVFVNENNQVVNDRATEVWVEVSHPNAEFIFSTINESQNQGFINEMKVTKFPTVIFAEQQNSTDWLTLARLEGNASKEQIKKVYLDMLNGKYEPGDGNNGTDQVIQGDESGMFPIGFGLLGIDLPPFAWLIIAGASGFKAATSKKQVGKIGFGGLAALSLFYYFKSKKQTR